MTSSQLMEHGCIPCLLFISITSVFSAPLWLSYLAVTVACAMLTAVSYLANKEAPRWWRKLGLAVAGFFTLFGTVGSILLFITA